MADDSLVLDKDGHSLNESTQGAYVMKRRATGVPVRVEFNALEHLTDPIRLWACSLHAGWCFQTYGGGVIVAPNLSQGELFEVAASCCACADARICRWELWWATAPSRSRPRTSWTTVVEPVFHEPRP